jgi:hypothetical protein
MNITNTHTDFLVFTPLKKFLRFLQFLHCIDIKHTRPYLLLFAFAISLSLTAQTIYYVDATKANNDGDGTSWATAKKDLQVALDTATPGDEIRVASGTYFPTDAPNGSTTNDRNKAFHLNKDLILKGSYDPATEMQDYTNPSILSGDIGMQDDNTDNAYHVFITVGLSSDTIIDGFTCIDVIFRNAESASSVTTADMDGDNDIDVLSASYSDDSILWYENDGTGNFTDEGGYVAHVIDSNAGGARAVAVADMDIDVLSASYSDGTIKWYENKGAEGFDAYTIDENAPGANTIAAADFNNDGNMDVVAGIYNAAEIRWYENNKEPLNMQRVLPQSIALHPNPMTNVLNISYISTTTVTYTLYDSTGKQLSSQPIQEKNINWRCRIWQVAPICSKPIMTHSSNTIAL